MEPINLIPTDYNVNVTMDDTTAIKLAVGIILVVVISVALSALVKKAVA